MNKFRRFVYTSFRLFCIRQEERLTAFVSLVAFTVLNALVVCKYWSVFSILTDNYRRNFLKYFQISGFDPLTYQIISDWFPAYNIYRHPLLAFFMWPFSMINNVLMHITGINFATLLTAVILIFCATYSVIFLFRILHNVLQVSIRQSNILCILYFSFSFIMLASMVPDHFVMSQFCLLLTLWITGEKLRKKSALNMWQTIVLFIFTAGVSLNNALKVYLAALITRGKRFFRLGYILCAVIIPAGLIWGFARWEYSTWEAPQYRARQEQKARIHKHKVEKLRAYVIDSMGKNTEKTKIEREVNRIIKLRTIAKYRHDHKQVWNTNKGKPFKKGEFIGWTDMTTSRSDAMIENLFGESIMLHENYLLGDILRNKPVITVHYRNWFNYVIEGFLVLLFIIGIWAGRSSRFLWAAMSFFIMDMFLHMGLGFGINEIYIMSPHFLFVLPIAIAFILKKMTPQWSKLLSTSLLVIACYLLVWNVALIVEYLYIL